MPTPNGSSLTAYQHENRPKATNPIDGPLSRYTIQDFKAQTPACTRWGRGEDRKVLAWGCLEGDVLVGLKAGNNRHPPTLHGCIDRSKLRERV